jgi:heptosyltransferase-1
MPSPGRVPRILFIKTSSLGDVVHHCPAVTEAGRRLPGAAIDWVVEEAFAEIPALHRSVRRTIPVAIRRWRTSLWRPAVWSEIAAFVAALRKERYDAVIDAQGLLKSALIAVLASGRRYGLDRVGAREALATLFYDTRHAVSWDLHAVERNRRLTAAALGYAAEGACDYGLRVEGEAPLAPGAPFAVLLTMSSGADKLWPEPSWVALGRWLAARGVRSVLPWGSPGERERCLRIAREIEGALVPERMTLVELARLMRAARAAVGVDTGLAHFAVALGVPSLGLYCGTDPAQTGLYGGTRTSNLGGVGAAPTPAAAQAALAELL